MKQVALAAEMFHVKHEDGEVTQIAAAPHYHQDRPAAFSTPCDPPP